MKLINQIIIKADCVEFFLRDLCKKYDHNTFIVDVIMQPHKFQDVFDKWRVDNGYENHSMDRPNKLGSVKDLIEPDECALYHENIDHEAMGRVEGRVKQ